LKKDSIPAGFRCQNERGSGAMSDDCCVPSGPEPTDRRYRRVLWAALIINGTMFLLEIVTGLMAGSVSLQADALDFLGDVANYGISLFVIGMALRYRAKAALIKGATMGIFGLWVIGAVIWNSLHQTLPHAVTMGQVGLAALVANAVVFWLLWTSRKGDSNMRSAWLCSRNDVIGNLAVLLAALGVFGTGTGWPDVIVAAIMAALGVQGAIQVIRHALEELKPQTSSVIDNRVAR
jgi:cation diffusion facilitator family transporter